MTTRYNVAVVGGGGAGSETAFRIGETKRLNVALIERDKLGGECNNYGCVPTKAMLKAAKIVANARDAQRYGIAVRDVQVDFPKVMQRVREIIGHFSRFGAKPFEDIGVGVYLGPSARFVDENTLELDDGRTIEASTFVIATGSKASVPSVEGLTESGFWTNEEAVGVNELPDSLAILGGGPIGVEFAQIFARLGTKVTVIEALERILGPEDAEASAVLAEALAEDGVTMLTRASLERVERIGPARRLILKDGRTINADELLVAVGRTPSFGTLDAGKAGVVLNERKRPVVDDSLRASDHVFVAGDATGELLFTHTASYEGQLVAEQILSGRPKTADYRVVPRVTYTDPEVASVGQTEQQARDEGSDVRVGFARFDDSERAYIEGERRGFVKIVADERTGAVLGGHIAGVGAGELIHEIVATMAGRVSATTVGNAIHAYPTWSESVRSALMQAGATT